MSKLVDAKVAQIKADTTRRNCSFVMRWAIIWLTLGGFIRLELFSEVIKWLTL